MKKQMKFQKIVCLIALLIAAIAFFFALGLLTDIYKVMFASQAGADKLFKDIQPFNRQLVNICILMIVLAVFLYITKTHVRRRYYISNYIALAVTIAVYVFLPIISILQILNFKKRFLTEIDFPAWLEMRELISDFPYTESTLWLDFNVVTQSLMILVSLLLAYNLLWKIRLMNFEDKLLSGEIKPKDLPLEV
ncbi:MAG TPA: hypothetical protein VIK96_05015 [Bacilli bacterium]